MCVHNRWRKQAKNEKKKKYIRARKKHNKQMHNANKKLSKQNEKLTKQIPVEKLSRMLSHRCLEYDQIDE